MTDLQRKSVLGIIAPDSEIDYFDRRALLGIYTFAAEGWTGKINGITSFYRINSILRTNIRKINGK